MSTPCTSKSVSRSKGPTVLPHRLTLALPAIAILALAAFLPRPALATDYAVVVNTDVEIDNLKFADMKKIMLGDRQFWKTGQRISIILRAPVAEERTFLLDRVFGMTEDRFRQYWIAKVFRAEVSAEPRIVLSTGEVVDLVGVIPGAIAVVRADEVPEGYKVLRIEGGLPGSPGYVLSDTAPTP